MDRNGPYLDTVRALHQTVVSLREALEQSKTEILHLKQRVWPVESLQATLTTLSIENHILRTSIARTDDWKAPKIERHDEKLKEITNLINPLPAKTSPVAKKHVTIVAPGEERASRPNLTETKDDLQIEPLDLSPPRRTLSSSLDNLSQKKTLTISKTVSFSNISEIGKRDVIFHPIETMSVESPVSPHHDAPPDEEEGHDDETKNETPEKSDTDQNDEVDDIELIFTTEDTKESDFKEELVPIDSREEEEESDQFLRCRKIDFDASGDASDRELEDDVFNETVNPICNRNFDYIERENSILYNSKSDNSINQEKSLKSYYSLQDSSFENKSLEKDESIDRFEERVRIIETDISKCGIIDVEYSTSGRRNTCPNPLPYRPIIHREALNKGLNTRKGRPILSHCTNARKDSSAQTDICAIPSSAWRSESSLGHKVKMGDFPTLPSKFPLPGSRLRLSEKTNVEARRVLLSDIGFTSMVPELSRSADHLFAESLKAPIPTTYGQFLRTPDLYSPGFTSQRFMWTTTASPTELTHSHSRCSSNYPLSSPPAPARRCSAPVSPSRRVVLKPTPSKVRFANGSLPELRSAFTSTGDSGGESTDSLVEEAEHFLRRSIDCIVTGREAFYQADTKPRGTRRASAPEPSGDNVPPQDWQPFLPRIPRDLHLDHWIKVIVPEGKVRGGRVRYVGPVFNQTEQYVGVQLSSPEGSCDGTFNNRRYFYCEPHHGIFVPFKKVVMGWRP